jgi:hypothetical protein
MDDASDKMRDMKERAKDKMSDNTDQEDMTDMDTRRKEDMSDETDTL